jgi:cation-transporting P-type ATPase 13A2
MDGESMALYRRGSNISQTSYVSEVEMAHDEVFAGPMSESVPNSTTGFAHRRSRADSTASFTYYPDEELSTESSSWQDDEAVIDGDFDDYEDSLSIEDRDLEAGRRPSISRRKSSGITRLSVEDPLLHRTDSRKDGSTGYDTDARLVQKVYVESEDLTIVFAGFKTSTIGYAVYLTLCICTGGLAYLLFRWIPSWKVALVGSPSPLSECTWMVIEV